MLKSLEWARQWTKLSAEKLGENREVLIDLDRQIGDGDHGENMDRGFAAVIRGNGLDGSTNAAEVMRYVAKTLMSTVGGAAGPLYGTAYLRAAQQFPEGELTGEDIVNIMAAAVQGIQDRGKAEAGEKTMVDAWLPAVKAAKMSVEADSGTVEVWNEIAQAARVGAESTIPMKATKGRASYLGERSVGHLDPGAVSSALILEAAAEAAQSIYGAQQ